MKKFIMCFAGAMLVLSLAACTPTPVKQSESATEPMVEASTGGASDKVPDPNVEPMEIISVYSSNEDATGLNQAMDAVDELTGLIGAVVLMRPSKSVQDLTLKSVKKKYKSKNFAAGCSREVIERGADMLGWTLDELIQRTIDALKTFQE